MGCTITTARDEKDSDKQYQAQPVAVPVPYYGVPSQPITPLQYGSPGYPLPQQQMPLYYGLPSQGCVNPVEFVRSIELSMPPMSQKLQSLKTAPVRFSNLQNQAFVNSGSIQAFTNTLTAQNIQDVINAMLFAQLAAAKTIDRQSYEAWYKQYITVLAHIGFVIQEFSMTKYVSHSKTLQMDRAVIGLLQAAATQQGSVVAAAAIEALGKLPGNEQSVTLFDDQSAKFDRGNFQATTAVSDPNGNVSITLGAFAFKTDKQEDRYLWVTWNTAEITFFQGVQRVILNEAVYSTVRQAILDKVKPFVQQMVANIEL